MHDGAAAYGLDKALLDPSAPTPAHLLGPAGIGAGRRFDVYRNNIAVGLAEALAANFPVIRRLLGEEAFRAVATMHARRHPPRSRLMFQYGADFAGFLRDFEPLSRFGYLPDVARLERAMLDAYHCADLPVVDAEILGSVAPECLASISLVAHDAMSVIRSPYAIVTIVEANRRPEEVGPVDAGIAEDALVTRPRYEPLIFRLRPGEATFLEALASGVPLQAAAERAAAEIPAFDLAAAVSTLVSSGAFTRIVLPDSSGAIPS